MGFITSLLVLSFLIFFHELGHFLAARFFGVKVEVFSIGFGKKIFTKVYKGTEYALSIIPLGGYVKMKGQDDLDPKKIIYTNDSYNTKPAWQRIVILFGGPFANFLLAFILYFIIGIAGSNTLTPTIGKINENSPAFEATLQEKDKVVAINNQNITTWDELSKYIQNSHGTLIFTIQRGSEILNLKVTPKVSETKNIFGEIIEKRMVGIIPSGETIKIYYSPIEAVSFGIDKTIEASKMIVLGIQKLIEGVVPLQEVGGVISIVQITSEVSANFIALLSLTALISVNLGVLNLLPIPALDGGHIIFNLYELITRKVPSIEVVYKLTIAGWIILFSLMFLGLYNDINRILSM